MRYRDFGSTGWLVSTISLGGAFVESKERLKVGDSFGLEIRAGLRKIQSTAVVRNIMPAGGGAGLTIGCEPREGFGAEGDDGVAVPAAGQQLRDVGTETLLHPVLAGAAEAGADAEAAVESEGAGSELTLMVVRYLE